MFSKPEKGKKNQPSYINEQGSAASFVWKSGDAETSVGVVMTKKK